jgi:(p)ppGpp synthase/HD superfamily hydrolase
VDEYSTYAILATLFGRKPLFVKSVLEKQHSDTAIAKAAIQLDAFKDKIYKFSTSQNIKEVRFWEILKKGYKKPQPKEVEHFIFFSNKQIEAIEFDHCCHPKVGDDIVAFYKDNKAIIHHKLCMNAYSKIMAGDSMLFVQWNSTKMSQYRLIVSLPNQKGELAKLLMKLSSMKLNVISIEFGISNGESAEYCNIEVESEVATKPDIEREVSKKFKLVDIVSLDDAYSH